MRARIASALLLLAGACNSPAPAPQNVAVVNGTEVEQPVAPGALGNEAVNYPEGPVTPGEQGNYQAVEQPSPGQVVQSYATLLEQRRFKEAYAMWEPNSASMSEKQFEKQFDAYKTIDAAVGTVGRTEGAAGSLYTMVQLTLSGNKKDGTSYVMTGPVTLRRVNDVPGSTAQQRSWHVFKMELTANPKAAESILKG
jgi:hypothetical protein